MTKAVIFSGSHSRHLYVHRGLIDLFDDLLVIAMDREEMNPEPPPGLDSVDHRNFVRHFRERTEVERNAYGGLTVSNTFGEVRYVHTRPESLNGPTVCEQVKSFDPDLAFVFGCDMIRYPLLNLLPKNSLNLHLGLSPWYRGSATLFWPFYFMEPQFAGVTFHRLSDQPDGGEIVHQSCPALTEKDGVHDVGARCVLDAARDARTIVKRMCDGGAVVGEAQRTSGRVWRTRDFRPSHLRIIYSLFDNDVVSHYLAGKLGSNIPRLYSCF